MIVFYSGTGNSRYCAQLLASKLGDEMIDCFHYIKDGIAADLCSEHPWVFVSPTYGWQLPHIFADFIRSGSFMGSRDAYFVMSCGSEIGDAGSLLPALCKEKGFEYRGVLEVLMPENYVALFAVPEADEAEKIISAAEPILNSGIEYIRQGKAFPPARSGLLDRFKTRAVNPIFYKYFIKATPFYSTDACIGCGKCEKVCITNNIRLENGKPKWGGNCTHCMACICSCPKSAIEYGRKSQGKPRYQCKEYRS